MDNMESRPVDTAERLIKSVELGQNKIKGSERFRHVLKFGVIGFGLGLLVVAGDILVVNTFVPANIAYIKYHDLALIPPLCAALSVGIFGFPKK